MFYDLLNFLQIPNVRKGFRAKSQVVVELLLDERGQRATVGFEPSEKLRVVRFDDPVERGLFGAVPLIIGGGRKRSESRAKQAPHPGATGDSRCRYWRFESIRQRPRSILGLPSPTYS